MKFWPFALAGVVGSLALTGAYAEGYRVNLTPSMPRGVWREIPTESQLKVGDIVVACPSLTPNQQRYVAPGSCPSGKEPMLKVVAAVGGDAVQVAQSGISVNGKSIPDSAPLPTDSTGRPLKSYPVGTYKVQQGEVWLVNQMSLSLDSRYIGPVVTTDILSITVPRIVW